MPEGIFNMSLRQTVVVLAAGVPQLILATNMRRAYLLIEDIGGADINLGWDAAPGAGLGTTLSPGGLGKQGGFLEFKAPCPIPTNALWAISAAGSTIVVSES